MRQITCGKVKGYTVGPNDVIPNGAPVAIGSRRGIVIRKWQYYGIEA